MNTRKRLNNAVRAGVKLSAIAIATDLSDYKLRAFMSDGSKMYRGGDLDWHEKARIESALDNIKNAF